MTHETAIAQGLDPVYPEAHELGDRVFFDPREGQYYDASTDLYLEVDDAKTPAGRCNTICGTTDCKGDC